MSKINKHELCFKSIISALSQLDKLNLGSYEQRTEVITTLLNKFEIINTEKLQHQLEIQTKRVENLKEGLDRAKQDIVFLNKYVTCPNPERVFCKCEFCQDRKHMKAESELNSCQAIDQELENELEKL